MTRLRNPNRRLLPSAVLTALLAAAPARAELPAGFVYLRALAPDIVQDLRYATPDNFTGGVVAGYLAPECILTRRTAAALARAQANLVQRHPDLTLKVYDCYRPVQAVQRFVRWVEEPGAPRFAYHHPAVARRDLISFGYISSQSGHSRGHAVDLTLARRAPQPAASPSRRRSCAGPLADREADASLDMGTAYDCLDARSHTASRQVGAEAMAARRLLVGLMAAQGLRNYPREWWHFTLDGADSGTAHDFPVTAAPSRP